MLDEAASLFSGRIGDDELAARFGGLPDLLEKIVHARDASAVEPVLGLVFQFDLLGPRYVDVLCTLLVADWHERHEDIARALQLLADPRAVPALRQAAELDLPYRDYDESRALTRRCCWALSDIRTGEAVAALQALSRSPDAVVRDLAVHHLAKIRDNRPPSPGSQRHRNR